MPLSCARSGDTFAVVSLLPGAPALFQWKPFLGPFHSVLLHFPIGFVVMAFLLDLYAVWRPSPELRKIVGLTLLLGVVTSLFTIFLGLMRSGSAEYDPGLLTAHKNYGIAVGVLTVATLLMHALAFRESGARRTALRGCFRLTLLGSIAVITVAGHQGGNLTHGTNYLTRNAPQFVRELIEDTPAADVSPAATAASDGERFFVENVKPVLELKCMGCHGPEKQKGEYRLDHKDIALQGGESGKVAIKPGAPLESYLVQVMLLPPGDDDVMPPTGKKTLTPEETMAVIRWIQMGAPFPEGAPPATATAAK